MTAIAAPERVRSAWTRVLEGLRGDDALQTAYGAVMVFLAPALLMYAAFTAYPVLRTFYNSLHVIRPGGRTEFVGLDNFIELLFNDDIFFRAVANTLTWAGIAPLIDVGVGLLLALCLYAKVSVLVTARKKMSSLVSSSTKLARPTNSVRPPGRMTCRLLKKVRTTG